VNQGLREAGSRPANGREPSYPRYNRGAGEGLRPFEPWQRPPRGCCDPLRGCPRPPWLRAPPRPSRCDARPTSSSTHVNTLPSPSDHPRRGYSPAFNSVDKWWEVPGITAGLARDSTPSNPVSGRRGDSVIPFDDVRADRGCDHLLALPGAMLDSTSSSTPDRHAAHGGRPNGEDAVRRLGRAIWFPSTGQC